MAPIWVGLWARIYARIWVRNRDRNCVGGGQGSPQQSGPERGLTRTLGSFMNRRARSLAGFRPALTASSFVSNSSSLPTRLIARGALYVALLAVLALASVPLRAESAGSMFKHGQAAEAREDYDTAVDLYQKALAKSPDDLAYRTALYRIRVSASGMHMSKGRKLLALGDTQGALAEFLHAAEVDSSNEAAQQEIARIRKQQGEEPPHGDNSLAQQAGTEEELDSMGSPVQLKPLSNEPLTLHYSEDAKVVYQAIGKAAGINVLFDPDYTSKRIQVDLSNSSLLDALRIVGVMSNTFWRPVTENTIFVAQNTRQKRTDLDESAVQTFYLTNAWQQNDLTDVQTAIRNVLTGGGFKIYAVPSQNAIVIRGTPDELLLAQKLINDLDKPRAEVVVDISILNVSKNWERTIGIAWPSSIGVALQAPNSTSSSSTTTTTTTTGSTSTGTSPSLYDLAHLKASDFQVTIGSATANLLLSDSNTKILQSPRIRATDAQKATLKIGERIPIATGSYGGGGLGGVGGVGGLGIGVQTQFQYQDVGVNIEMTPTVHYDHDVTLKIKIDISSQASSVTISGITEPIIAQNVVDQVIRLREGEASILGGIKESQETVSWSGIPGLSSIPLLKYLFGSKDHTINDDDLVFLVVPHIVRTQSLDRANLRTIDTGSGATVEVRRVPVAAPESSAPAPAPVTPASPATEPRSSIGVVPGQSAAAAAPAALAQLDAAAKANGQTISAQVPAPGLPPVQAAPPNPALAQPAPGTPIAVLPAPGPSGSAQPSAGRPFVAPVMGSVNVMFSPPGGPVAAGSTFQVPLVLAGAKDVVSVPLQVQYDPAKLSLVNVTQGDLLGRDNQAVTLIHRDDGPGSVTINAARPPGTPGISGAGVVCVMSFQAKAAGETALSLVRASAINTAQQPVPAPATRAMITIR